MEPETRELLADTAMALEEQIRLLAEQEARLRAQIGDPYVAILEELSRGGFERDEEQEIRGSLSYPERKLLWVWARLDKLRCLRQELGRDAIRGAFDPRPPSP
jgi:hypothetical protein